jgi:hypothetical protein
VTSSLLGPNILLSTLFSNILLSTSINPLVLRDYFSWCAVWWWEIQSHLKSSAMKMQNKWWPLKSWVVSRVHCVLNYSTKELQAFLIGMVYFRIATC